MMDGIILRLFQFHQLAGIETIFTGFVVSVDSFAMGAGHIQYYMSIGGCDMGILKVW
jgi:hypothetical protein